MKITQAERQALQSAMDAPMADDEAVSLIAEAVALVGEVLKVAPQQQQGEVLPTFIRAGNMIHYVSARLAAATEALALLQELIDIEGPQPGHAEWARKVRTTIDKAAGEQP